MQKEYEIKKSRFLVTGGLGFVGSAIARRLLQEGAREVVLFDLKKDPPDFLKAEEGHGRLRILTGDICNQEEVSRAVSGCDYVFHQAGLRVTRCAKEPRMAYRIMVDGTLNIALACIENKVKKLIHASSAIVYGEPLHLPLDEEHPAHDTTLYGIFKEGNEKLLKSFKKNWGLDYIVLRYFNIYGPGMNLFGPEIEVLIRWLGRIDEGLPPLVFGDGTQTLDWIFIDDIVEANWLAALSQRSGEIFNVCTGRETSVADLLKLLLEITGSNLEPAFQESRAINQVSRRFGSPEKAANQLGFSAKVPLESGLRALVKWRQAQLAMRDKSCVENNLAAKKEADEKMA